MGLVVLTWQLSTHSTVSGTRTPHSSHSCVMPTFTAIKPVRRVRAFHAVGAMDMPEVAKLGSSVLSVEVAGCA